MHTSYPSLFVQTDTHKEDKTAHQVKYSQLSKISHIISIIKVRLEMTRIIRLLVVY